jgi:hypothetical protein
VNPNAWDEVLAQYYRVLRDAETSGEADLLRPEIEASAVRLRYYLAWLNDTLPAPVEPNPALLSVLG